MRDVPARWLRFFEFTGDMADVGAAAMLDEQAPNTGGGGFCGGGIGDGLVYGAPGSGQTRVTGHVDKNGGASQFFYVAKASSAERNAGLDGFEERDAGVMEDDAYQWKRDGHGVERERRTRSRNVHPTVKPIALMRWLVRLVTPPDGLVLDPFTGSGTTGCAAVLEGFRFLGVEREAEYAAIARTRIAWWGEHPDGMELVRRLEHEKERRTQDELGQGTLFDFGEMT